RVIWIAVEQVVQVLDKLGLVGAIGFCLVRTLVNSMVSGSARIPELEHSFHREVFQRGDLKVRLRGYVYHLNVDEIVAQLIQNIEWSVVSSKIFLFAIFVVRPDRPAGVERIAERIDVKIPA